MFFFFYVASPAVMSAFRHDYSRPCCQCMRLTLLWHVPTHYSSFFPLNLWSTLDILSMFCQSIPLRAQCCLYLALTSSSSLYFATSRSLSLSSRGFMSRFCSARLRLEARAISLSSWMFWIYDERKRQRLFSVSFILCQINNYKLQVSYINTLCTYSLVYLCYGIKCLFCYHCVLICVSCESVNWHCKFVNLWIRTPEELCSCTKAWLALFVFVQHLTQTGKLLKNS